MAQAFNLPLRIGFPWQTSSLRCLNGLIRLSSAAKVTLPLYASSLSIISVCFYLALFRPFSRLFLSVSTPLLISVFLSLPLLPSSHIGFTLICANKNEV